MLKILHKHYLQRYHGVYQHAKQLFVFDLFLLSLALLLFGASILFFFWKPGITNLIDLSISMGDQRIKSGDQVHLVIHYANRSKYSLHNVNLALRLPPGFTVDHSRTPPDLFSEDNTFPQIRTLKAGASGEANVYGRLWLEPKNDFKIIALLSYTPDGTTRPEQVASYFLTNLPESIVHGTLSTADSALAKQAVPFTLTFNNTSSERIDRFGVRGTIDGSTFIIPPGTAQPIPAHDTYTVSGTVLAPDHGGTFVLRFTPYVEVSNTTVLLVPLEKKLVVAAPQTSIHAQFIEPRSSVAASDVAPMTISWKNTGPLPILNGVVRLSFSPTGIVDMAQTAELNHLKTEGDSLIINGSARTGLAKLSAGDQDSIGITVSFLPHFNDGGVENASLAIVPTLNGTISGISGQEFSATGETLSIPLSSELSMTAETRYFTDEGDQLGRGPLPPKVGATTKYWIYVTVNNTTNAVNDASFSASLAPGVEFTGAQSVTIGKPVAVSANNGQLNWKYYQLPPHSQTGLFFEVSVTPTPNSIGQVLPLVSNIHFSAADSRTGKSFTLSSEPVTTQLPQSDRGARAPAAVMAP